MNRVMLLGTGYLGIIMLTGKDRKKAAESGFLLSADLSSHYFYD